MGAVDEVIPNLRRRVMTQTPLDGNVANDNYREKTKVLEEEEEEEEGRLKTSSIRMVDVTLEFIATCIFSDP